LLKPRQFLLSPRRGLFKFFIKIKREKIMEVESLIVMLGFGAIIGIFLGFFLHRNSDIEDG